ncbi:MAG TPA: hypothetical protein VME70_07520 [Mycobacteriales bacterium]|nr:hypothetical protein [Mycobacteriales bacterium]
MSAELVALPATGGNAAGPATVARSASVTATRAARHAVRAGAVWGLAFGAYIASQALGYASAYPTRAQRAALAGQFSSGGLNALMGPARDLSTVAGYTAWKSLTVLTIVGSVWGLLSATKMLRGEEDTGRWEVLLAGRTTARRATAQTLVGLGAGLVTLFSVTAVITVILGRGSKVPMASGSALYFALSVTCGAGLYVAGGALAGQLVATRRQAAALTGGFFGVSFALRAVADTVRSLSWLRWVSPLGWVEELRPLTGSHPLALAPIAASTVAMAAGAIWLAGRRDLDASVFPDRSRARPRTALLTGPIGLAVRLGRGGLAGWLAAVLAETLLLTSVTSQEIKTLRHTSGATGVFTRLSGHAAIGKAYLSVVFLMVALVVMLMAAGQIVAARHEEAAGRLDHLLVRPVSRTRWYVERVALAVGIGLLGGLVGGACAAAVVSGQHLDVSARSVVAAGLNMVPPTACAVGIAAFALAVAPRLTAAVTYTVITWSFLVELLGGITASSRWLLDTSLLHQMAAAPARAPNLLSSGLLVAVSGACVVAGALIFARRDLVDE